MGQVTAILRKDVRRLWPQLAAALGLTALMGWLDDKMSGSGIGIAQALWALCWIYLTARVVQQERLPGDRQYWLTRPYDWRCLLMAKALFVAAFAVVPLVAAKSVALALSGVSPLRYASTLVCSSVLFGGVVALTAAVLAALTESLLQFLWAFLALSGVAAAAILVRSGSAPWGALAWLAAVAWGAIIAAVAVPVLLLQYSRRLTFVGRSSVAGVALVAVAAPLGTAWHAAWDLQSRLASPQPDAAPVSFSFGGGATARVRYADAPWFPGLQQEGFYIPIRVSGIPAGAAVVSKRAAVTIEGEGGRRWSSGWTPDDAIAAVDPLEDRRLIRADGPAWQYLNVDRAFCEAVHDTPVRIHVSVALVLLGGARTTGIIAAGRTDHLPMDGICEVRQVAVPLPGRVRGIEGIGYLGVFCAWPRPGPERAYLRTGVPTAGDGSHASLLVAGSGGPLSLDQSVWQRGAAIVPVREAPRFSLETWRAEAWLERSFDIDGVRLSGYAVPRITDPE
jgi:hypothetical protein